MPNLLALLASLGWGASDFLGGFAARRIPPALVTAIAQIAGMTTMFAVVALTGPQATDRDTLLGVAAGVAGPLGLIFLYRALSLGPMNVAAPTAAVSSTGTTLLIGVLLREETFTGVTLLGALTGIVAVVAVSQTPDADTDDRLPGHVRRTLRVGLLAGVFLGLANLCFSETSASSGVWSVAVARAVATAICVVPVVRVRPESRALPRHELRLAAAAGATDALATTSITLAFQRGSVILVGVLGGLFPAITVLLARIFLGERMGRPQVVGLAFAIATIVLFAVA